MERKVYCELCFDEDTGDWYEMATHFEYEADYEKWYRIYSVGEYIGNVRLINNNHMAPWEAVETGILHESFHAACCDLESRYNENGCF